MHVNKQTAEIGPNYSDIDGDRSAGDDDSQDRSDRRTASSERGMPIAPTVDTRLSAPVKPLFAQGTHPSVRDNWSSRIVNRPLLTERRVH